ncbi:MAG: hypothetical protein RR587_09495, partial [Solibacillus sp.]
NKLFATTAIATAALVVPMDAFAAEVSPVKILGNNIVGAVLKADILLTPENGTPKYQWFHDEGLDANGDPKHTELTGATANTYKILPRDVGKALIVKVTIDDVDGPVEHPSGKVVVDKTMPVKGDNFVNGTLYADIESLKDEQGDPIQETFKSYQWYYFENDKKTPIAGATKYELIIPVEAAEKNLIVEVKTESGQTYTSELEKIGKLKLAIDDELILEGFSPLAPNKFALPGDKLTVVNPVVKDVDRELKANQIAYSYQWMYKVDKSYSYIEGATAATYTIPKDALDKEMKNIVVSVTAKVGTAEISKFSPIVEVANSPAGSLIGNIGDLLGTDATNNSKVYNPGGLESFGVVINDLNSKYAALTAAAKANVTNYDILKRATEDHALMTALKDKVDKANEITDATAKLQEFKSLWAEYEQLDLLQRSLDSGSGMFAAIQTGLDKTLSTFEITEVIAINKDILGLLEDLTTGGTGQSYELVQYKVKEIAKLQEAITKIENRIAELSNDYQMTIQNKDILITAKSDIKKVQAFLAKVEKIDLTATVKKQKTAAKSVRTDFEKLNVKQQSLVSSNIFDKTLPDNLKSKLILAEEAAEEDVKSVQEGINKFITPGDTNSYKPIPITEEIKKEINKTITDYKALTKESALKITGYAEFLQLQKDIKIAEKVRKQLENYGVLFESGGGNYSSKLKSAYNSTTKAFNKLTSLQKSLIEEADRVKLKVPGEQEQKPDGDLTDGEKAAKAQGTAFIGEIDTALALVTGDFNTYSQEIEAVVLKYKNGLPSKARKYVTNYAVLQAAEKDIKAVKSFLKKVDQANIEADAGKRYSKIEGVQKAFLKLPATQQKFVAQNEAYKSLIASMGGTNDKLGNFDGEIAALIDDANVVKIKELEAEYKTFSSAEKKKVKNYNVLKQALADVKKVEAFNAKYVKMQEDMPSSVASTIKAFNALTDQQAKLVDPEIRNKMIKLEIDQRDTNTEALDLIDRINGLVDSDGKYVEYVEYVKDPKKLLLQEAITYFRTAYDNLLPEERSLVKNYSKLTRAESDLLKVKEVRVIEVIFVAIGDEDENKVEKEAARKDWQKAFNRLSRQQENLYLMIYPERK